jgi:hypothetical protein
MKLITATLTGTRPLLMHNERLANPLDPHAIALKEVTKKRQKTEDDYWLCAEREFAGGIYCDDEVGPYIPGIAIRALLLGAARKMKLGKQLEEGVMILDPMNKLEYKGPRTVAALWKAKFYDQRMVGNQNVRVLRTRPMFKDWTVSFRLAFDPSFLNEADIKAIVTRGETIGLMDYRPVFGTFASKCEAAVSFNPNLAEAA